MLTLNTLKPQPGSKKSGKRLGRGPGSGWGQTAGKGVKGQLARTGGHVAVGFEGGQSPLYRRIPKRGFKPLDSTDVIRELNLSDLERMATQGLKEISMETLRAGRLLRGQCDRLVILGQGELSKAVKVTAHRVSGPAAEKIKKAGGSVNVIAMGSLAKKRLEQYRATKKKS